MTQATRSPRRRSRRQPRRDLSGHAYACIKDLIRHYELRPGEKLTQSELARRAGVSLTPVREALRTLAHEGYVVPVRNRGFYVAEITLKEAEELFDVREALEVLAVQGAVVRRDGAFLQALETCCAEYQRVVTHALTRERIQIDQRFHLLIAGQADNETARRMLQSVFERITLKRKIEGAPPTRGLVAYDEHVAILEAIRAGDATRAMALVALHVRNAKAAVRHQLRERQARLET